MREPEVSTSSTVLDKPTTSNFYVKAYDSTLEPIGNIETTIQLSNVVRKPFVSVARLADDATTYTKIGVAFRARKTINRYRIKLTNNSEYVTLDEEETGALGDPYVKTLEGGIYKLPDENAVYRLFQAGGLIINGETRLLSNDEAINTALNAKTLLAEGNYNISNPDSLVFQNMCFFNRIYINNEGRETLIDLDTLEMFNNGLEYILNEYDDTEQNILPIYSGIRGHIKEIVFQNPDIDWIALRLHMYNNLQIRNGVSLYLDKTRVPSGSSGIFRRIDRPIPEYKLSGLNDCSLLSSYKGGNMEYQMKKEIFFRNDGQQFEMDIIV
jgi:hypothetical protein